LKREYDFNELARQYGFNKKEIEKVCRISELLESISAVKFLSDRLSLYGGTAFTFIYSPEILRLSVDLDFNYRHKGEGDWGQMRDEVDVKLKDVLYRLGYMREDVAIDPHYQLQRFAVSYVNELGLRDKFNIEIGYMRRTPILTHDILADFKNISTQETFKTTTPLKEELFANKWCTLLYRGSPRDLFDVSQMANIKFNAEAFRKCAIVDSLTHQTPRINSIDPTIIEQIRIDERLTNLLQLEKLAGYDYQQMKLRVEKFTKTYLSKMTKEEIQAVDQFYERGIFDPNMIDDKMIILNDMIGEYPAIKRTLIKLGFFKAPKVSKSTKFD
jgi:predicted nucleotidyltransferase component of viral defense system